MHGTRPFTRHGQVHHRRGGGAPGHTDSIDALSNSCVHKPLPLYHARVQPALAIFRWPINRSLLLLRAVPPSNPALSRNTYTTPNQSSCTRVEIPKHVCNERCVPIRRRRGCEFLPRPRHNAPTHAEFELAACSAKLGANFLSTFVGML